MIETEVQKLVIDAVVAHGGAGEKLSHRFKVGICDLLLKLPAEVGLNKFNTVPDIYPPMLMEVKLDKIKDPTRIPGHPIVPAVTVPQFSFLTKFAKAGTLCGVMSFIEDRRGKKGLWLKMAQVAPGLPYRPGFAFRAGDYEPLGDHTVRDRNIVALLKVFAETAR